jgi:hypothetical protein
MDAGLRVDELGVDANRIGDLLNRPLENVTDMQLVADLLGALARPLVDEGRLGGDDEEVGKAAELRGYVLGQAIAKILLRGVVAQVVQG